MLIFVMLVLNCVRELILLEEFQVFRNSRSYLSKTFYCYITTIYTIVEWSKHILTDQCLQL